LSLTISHIFDHDYFFFQIFVAGGFGTHRVPLNTVDVYDVASGTTTQGRDSPIVKHYS
jgi:hypothetical protein